MRPSFAYFTGGLLASLAVASLVTAMTARAQTFDARWVPIATSGKQDRLTAPQAQDGGGVTAITDGAARTTFIQKAVQPDERSGKRNLPEATAGKQKILEGCDPSFSPVTMPALAHVTGRCIV